MSDPITAYDRSTKYKRNNMLVSVTLRLDDLNWLRKEVSKASLRLGHPVVARRVGKAIKEAYRG